MKVMISGASGFIGSQLVPHLKKRGIGVRCLVRHSPRSDDEVEWDLSKSELNFRDLEGVDGVINLSGENIAALRWTAEKKRKILDSRLSSTDLLVKTFSQLKNPPKVLINASAAGYYGNRGEEILTESSPSGTGFLAEVCREWELAAENAKQLGIRVVCLRTGVVLSEKGGVLAKMLPPFKWGLGGVLGTGEQYMSWIALKDWIDACTFALENSLLQDALNLTAPQPVTNLEFTQALGKALHRPTLFGVPAFALRGIMGEAADEMLLGSIRAIPERLKGHGFRFSHPELESALAACLRL